MAEQSQTRSSNESQDRVEEREEKTRVTQPLGLHTSVSRGGAEHADDRHTLHFAEPPPPTTASRTRAELPHLLRRFHQTHYIHALYPWTEQKLHLQLPCQLLYLQKATVSLTYTPVCLSLFPIRRSILIPSLLARRRLRVYKRLYSLTYLLRFHFVIYKSKSRTTVQLTLLLRKIIKNLQNYKGSMYKEGINNFFFPLPLLLSSNLATSASSFSSSSFSYYYSFYFCPLQVDIFLYLITLPSKITFPFSFRFNFNST